ncbi:MAG: molybdopterin-synthase adenylyltransferase MoeB [Bacteroidota bacterium]|jgi:adenylyltransferase/sulfurtransferase
MPLDDEIILSKAEMNRYDRQILLPEFGLESQRKLKAAKVLVVGSGGLGCPLLLYLVAAGVGTIGIVEDDVVDESNLQRQVLFGKDDVGAFKTDAAKKRLEALNPHVSITLYNTRFSSENALDILKKYDVVADGTDNFPTRYLINDAAVMLQKPIVYASIYQFEGQVSVFNYTNDKGVLGPNYRDLHPTPPPPGLSPNCAASGVLGVLPGIIGSIQANEVIKIITGIGTPLHGRLFMLDALHFETRFFNIIRRDDNPLNGKNPTMDSLIDYEFFCGEKPTSNVKEISGEELVRWQQSGEIFQLIDVREPHEFDSNNIGAELIPLATLATNTHKLSRDRKVVIHCHSGERSIRAIQVLEDNFGFQNLYNLKGGLVAYQALS